METGNRTEQPQSESEQPQPEKESMVQEVEGFSELLKELEKAEEVNGELVAQWDNQITDLETKIKEIKAEFSDEDREGVEDLVVQMDAIREAGENLLTSYKAEAQMLGLQARFEGEPGAELLDATKLDAEHGSTIDGLIEEYLENNSELSEDIISNSDALELAEALGVDEAEAHTMLASVLETAKTLTAVNLKAEADALLSANESGVKKAWKFAKGLASGLGSGMAITAGTAKVAAIAGAAIGAGAGAVAGAGLVGAAVAMYGIRSGVKFVKNKKAIKEHSAEIDSINTSSEDGDESERKNKVREIYKATMQDVIRTSIAERLQAEAGEGSAGLAEVENKYISGKIKDKDGLRAELEKMKASLMPEEGEPDEQAELVASALQTMEMTSSRLDFQKSLVEQQKEQKVKAGKTTTGEKIYEFGKGGAMAIAARAAYRVPVLGQAIAGAGGWSMGSTGAEAVLSNKEWYRGKEGKLTKKGIAIKYGAAAIGAAGMSAFSLAGADFDADAGEIGRDVAETIGAGVRIEEIEKFEDSLDVDSRDDISQEEARKIAQEIYKREQAGEDVSVYRDKYDEYSMYNAEYAEVLKEAQDNYINTELQAIIDAGGDQIIVEAEFKQIEAEVNKHGGWDLDFGKRVRDKIWDFNDGYGTTIAETLGVLDERMDALFAEKGLPSSGQLDVEQAAKLRELTKHPDYGEHINLDSFKVGDEAKSVEEYWDELDNPNPDDDFELDGENFISVEDFLKEKGIPADPGESLTKEQVQSLEDAIEKLKVNPDTEDSATEIGERLITSKVIVEGETEPVDYEEYLTKSAAAGTVAEVAESGVSVEGVEAVKATAEHFGFVAVEGQEGHLSLDMAEAAKEDTNMGKLEQVLDRLVAAKFIEEMQDGMSAVEAGQILNMAANIRVVLEGSNDGSFMNNWDLPEGIELAEGQTVTDLLESSIQYENNILTITDQEGFSKLSDILKAHATEVVTDEKGNGAVGEVFDVKQETWAQIGQGAQEKEIEVPDFTEDERVKAQHEANVARETVGAPPSTKPEAPAVDTKIDEAAALAIEKEKATRAAAAEKLDKELDRRRLGFRSGPRSEQLETNLSNLAQTHGLTEEESTAFVEKIKNEFGDDDGKLERDDFRDAELYVDKEFNTPKFEEMVQEVVDARTEEAPAEALDTVGYQDAGAEAIEDKVDDKSGDGAKTVVETPEAGADLKTKDTEEVAETDVNPLIAETEEIAEPDLSSKIESANGHTEKVQIAREFFLDKYKDDPYLKTVSNDMLNVYMGTKIDAYPTDFINILETADMAMLSSDIAVMETDLKVSTEAFLKDPDAFPGHAKEFYIIDTRPSHEGELLQVERIGDKEWKIYEINESGERGDQLKHGGFLFGKGDYKAKHIAELFGKGESATEPNEGSDLLPGGDAEEEVAIPGTESVDYGTQVEALGLGDAEKATLNTFLTNNLDSEGKYSAIYTAEVSARDAVLDRLSPDEKNEYALWRMQDAVREYVANPDDNSKLAKLQVGLADGTPTRAALESSGELSIIEAITKKDTEVGTAGNVTLGDM